LVCCLCIYSNVNAQPKEKGQPAKKAAPKGKSAGAAWKAEMTMIDAINAAVQEVSSKYSDAEPFKAELKYTKKGGKYIVQVKIEDTKCVKVDVDFNGKVKVNDKKGEFFNVPKGAVKDQSALPEPEPKGKGKKKKAAAEEEEEM
ncbi:MAG TPA: hypothetical protein PLM75_05515, partial [bacterium]|nr:hypothetical protein [bacterium]